MVKDVVGNGLAAAVVETPVGALTLGARERGLVRCEFGAGRAQMGSAEACAMLERGVRELKEYFAGARREFEVPLLPEGTAFQESVWRALCTIGYGETSTYGAIGARVGNPKGSRAVGLANNRNPLPIFVPCHRVLNARGELHGYGGGLEAKRWLLVHEGAEFRESVPRPSREVSAV